MTFQILKKLRAINVLSCKTIFDMQRSLVDVRTSCKLQRRRFREGISSLPIRVSWLSVIYLGNRDVGGPTIPGIGKQRDLMRTNDCPKRLELDRVIYAGSRAPH